MGRPSLEKPFLTELLGHCKGFLFRFLKQYKKKRCLKEGPKKTTYHVLPNSLNIFIKKKAISVVEPITHSETPKNSQAVEWVRQFTEDRGTVGSQPNMERSAEDEFEELNSELHSLHPSYKEQSKTTKKVMKKAIKSVDIPLAPQQKKHAMRLYQNHANLFSSPQGWAHIAFLSILHVYLSSKKETVHDWHELVEEIVQLEQEVQTITYDAKAIISVIKTGNFHPQFISLFNKLGFTFNPYTQCFEAQAIQ